MPHKLKPDEIYNTIDMAMQQAATAQAAQLQKWRNQLQFVQDIKQFLRDLHQMLKPYYRPDIKFKLTMDEIECVKPPQNIRSLVVNLTKSDPQMRTMRPTRIHLHFRQDHDDQPDSADDVELMLVLDQHDIVINQCMILRGGERVCNEQLYASSDHWQIITTLLCRELAFAMLFSSAPPQTTAPAAALQTVPRLRGITLDIEGPGHAAESATDSSPGP